MGKSPKEIRNLVRAAKITKEIFGIISKGVKPGVRESKLKRDIEKIIKERGLKRSFRTIVASGPNAAKPHARITQRKIKTNDLIVIDFGVIYKGYHSDFTRTVIVGRISPAMRKLYKTVKIAQKMAIKRVSAGLKISDFVGDIHNYMRKKGFGKYILHGLGHGIGTKIHEAPKLSEKNKRTFKNGVVVTIEPGLYIKGRCGTRIEDMVLVTEGGCEVLTR